MDSYLVSHTEHDCACSTAFAGFAFRLCTDLYTHRPNSFLVSSDWSEPHSLIDDSLAETVGSWVRNKKGLIKSYDPVADRCLETNIFDIESITTALITKTIERNSKREITHRVGWSHFLRCFYQNHIDRIGGYGLMFSILNQYINPSLTLGVFIVNAGSSFPRLMFPYFDELSKTGIREAIIREAGAYIIDDILF